MTEYITKEQAWEIVKIVARHGGVDSIINADKRLANMPAADVVRVVRCKDCEHSRKNGIFLWCDRWKHGTNPEGDGWCYLGEKKREKHCPQCGSRMDGEEE